MCYAHHARQATRRCTSTPATSPNSRSASRGASRCPPRNGRVARAAELHDIGKVGVPDAILDKPGPLDDDEWAFMRQHTLIGERILSAAPPSRPVARLVRSSHERWDGAGYPDGLEGAEIPLGARIIAACDAYEAMTADRPYSPALSPAGRSPSSPSAGTQFDPEVVEALLHELRPPPAGHPTPATIIDDDDASLEIAARRVRDLLDAGFARA